MNRLAGVVVVDVGGRGRKRKSPTTSTQDKGELD
jgi:hypothetical protein